MKIKSYIILLLLFFTNICFAISITDRNQIERENYHNAVKRGVNGVINDSKGTIQYVYNNWGESAGNITKNYWRDISNGLEFELLSQFNNPYNKYWSLSGILFPNK